MYVSGFALDTKNGVLWSPLHCTTKLHHNTDLEFSKNLSNTHAEKTSYTGYVNV